MNNFIRVVSSESKTKIMINTSTILRVIDHRDRDGCIIILADGEHIDTIADIETIWDVIHNPKHISRPARTLDDHARDYKRHSDGEAITLTGRGGISNSISDSIESKFGLNRSAGSVA